MAPHDAANCKKPMETNNSTDSITQRHTAESGRWTGKGRGRGEERRGENSIWGPMSVLLCCVLICSFYGQMETPQTADQLSSLLVSSSFTLPCLALAGCLSLSFGLLQHVCLCLVLINYNCSHFWLVSTWNCWPETVWATVFGAL